MHEELEVGLPDGGETLTERLIVVSPPPLSDNNESHPTLMIGLQIARCQLLAAHLVPGHFRELGPCRCRPQILHHEHERYPRLNSVQRKCGPR